MDNIKKYLTHIFNSMGGNSADFIVKRDGTCINHEQGLNKRVKIYVTYIYLRGYAVVQLVEALRYKPEGRGFDSRWCHLNISLT